MNNLTNYLEAETFIIENGIYENCETKFEAAKILLPKECHNISRQERFEIFETIQKEKRVNSIRKTFGVLSNFPIDEPKKKHSEHDYESVILAKQDWEQRFD